MLAEEGVGAAQDELVDNGRELRGALGAAAALLRAGPRLAPRQDRRFIVPVEVLRRAQHPRVAEVHHRIELRSSMPIILLSDVESLKQHWTAAFCQRY